MLIWLIQVTEADDMSVKLKLDKQGRCAVNKCQARDLHRRRKMFADRVLNVSEHRLRGEVEKESEKFQTF